MHASNKNRYRIHTVYGDKIDISVLFRSVLDTRIIGLVAYWYPAMNRVLVILQNSEKKNSIILYSRMCEMFDKSN